MITTVRALPELELSHIVMWTRDVVSSNCSVIDLPQVRKSAAFNFRWSLPKVLKTYYGVDLLRAVYWITSLAFSSKLIRMGFKAGIFSALYALVIGGSEMVQLVPQHVQVGSIMVTALLPSLSAVRACRWIAGVPMLGKIIPSYKV